ncbi:MAG TPA: gamma-glutamylcyclotransferase family protein [Gammaproteobacteria bacterium]|nr:gamma-glutamylcyclotransferase family protein [Gammaproteobacteria bacterium]
MISSRLAGRDSLLFVYGTLRPCVDIEMARWLRRSARYLGGATTPGRLYDLGAYPGMRTARSGRERVVGDVYRVTNPRVFRVLDRYEASFARERCLVKLARGVRRTAWAYRYCYGVAGAPRIASGDYGRG